MGVGTDAALPVLTTDIGVLGITEAVVTRMAALVVADQYFALDEPGIVV